MTDTNKLGKRVSKYREQLGLTQEQLAVNAGLDLAYLQDVESGAIYPPIGMLIRLSRALGQRLGTFMDDQFVPDPIIVRASSRAEETSSRHGLKDYTCEAINLAGDYKTLLLECAEYGAGLNFTVMSADTSILQDSAYSCYTSAGYQPWKDEIIATILKYQNDMKGLNRQRIDSHEILADGVAATVYEDGTRVYVNYTDVDYTSGAVTVPAREYIVERGDRQ